jgi:hypothetical protein
LSDTGGSRSVDQVAVPQEVHRLDCVGAGRCDCVGRCNDYFDASDGSIEGCPVFEVAENWKCTRFDQRLIPGVGSNQHAHLVTMLEELACDQTAELSGCSNDQLHERACSITCCTALSALIPSRRTGSR